MSILFMSVRKTRVRVICGGIETTRQTDRQTDREQQKDTHKSLKKKFSYVADFSVRAILGNHRYLTLELLQKGALGCGH